MTHYFTRRPKPLRLAYLTILFGLLTLFALLTFAAIGLLASAEPASAQDSADTSATDSDSSEEQGPDAGDSLLPNGRVPEEFTLDTTQLGLGRSIRLARPAGLNSFIVPTPPGLLLTQFDATISVPSNVHQTFVSISVNGEVIYEDIIDGGSQRAISEQIPPASGDALIEIQAEEYAGGQCTSPVIEPNAAEISEPVFTFRAQPSLPSTVAQFLPQVVQHFDIYVDDDRPAHVDEAVLLLATNLATRYPSTPRFRIIEASSNISTQIDDDPFTRSIMVRDSQTGRVDLENNGTVAFLRLSGPDGLLSDIAASINSPEIGLISSDQVDTVGKRFVKIDEPEKRRTLRDAGVRRLQASDAVRLQLPITLPQARFGQPVNRIRVRLGGVLVHATPADVEPVVTIWVNEDLLTTVELDKAGRFDTELEIVGTTLGRDNLVVVRSELPIDCGFGLPTHELQLDTSSWVEVDYGQSLPVGLDRFPQAFLQGFKVRPGQSVADLQVTANLLAVMQSVSPLPLLPEIASWDEIIDDSDPGILVGGSAQQLDDLDAPISATGGNINVDGVDFIASGGFDEIAVIQALVGPNNQDLLHLQLAVDDSKAVSSAELSDLLISRGWGGFRGRAFAVNDGNNIVVPSDENLEDLALPTLTSDPPAPTRQLFGLGIIFALVASGVLLALRALLAQRRGMTRRPVGGG